MAAYASLLPKDKALFFQAASIVADSFAAFDYDGVGILSGTDAQTLGFLRALSGQIFLNASEIFVRLRNGEQLPGAEGLNGRALASNILSFEQGLSQKILDGLAPIGSDNRNILVSNINALSTPPQSGALFLADDRLETAIEKANKNGFNFANKADRVRVGEALFDELTR